MAQGTKNIRMSPVFSLERYYEKAPNAGLKNSWALSFS